MALDKLTLLFAVYPGNTHLQFLPADQQALCDHLAATGKAALLELQDSTGKEQVLAYACDDQGVKVVRGMYGTKPRFWSAQACVCYLRDEDPCVALDDGCNPCDVPNPWDMVTVGDGLEIDRTDPRAPVLRLKATGVRPGNYGGAEVNEFGQFTSVPPGWPASALPLFDPCSCAGSGDGGTGGPISAVDVTFSSCGFTGATNVQDAICELERWASGLAFDPGVIEVTAGDGIDVSGTTSHPVVALQPTGITPGTYAGFEVNQYGQIINYTPVPVDHPTNVATAPLHVTYDPVNNEWSHTVDWASYVQPGVVQFVSMADITNETVPPAQEEWAITYEGAKELFRVELTKTGLQNFDISALPAAANVQPTDDLAIYNYTSGQHERISLGDIAEFVAAASVLLEYDPATATTGASKGISAVASAGVGVFTVTLAQPLSNPVITVSIRGDLPLAKVTVEQSTATTLTVRTYDLEVVGATLQATPADHPFYLAIHEAI